MLFAYSGALYARSKGLLTVGVGGSVVNGTLSVVVAACVVLGSALRGV